MKRLKVYQREMSGANYGKINAMQHFHCKKIWTQ